jgi:hypothetical protein
MKNFVSLLLAAALPCGVMAQTAPAPEPTTPEKKSSTPIRIQIGPKTTPAPKAATTKAGATDPKSKTGKTADKAAAKKEEPPAKIEGMEIPRSSKGILGLQVVDGNFKLSFYSAEKKPEPPNVVRAVLRWTPNYKPGTEIYVLGPGDGKSLTVAKTVRPPYNFKLFLSLFVDGKDDPVESYVVDFRQ